MKTDTKKTSHSGWKIYSIIISCIAILSIAGFLLVFFRAGYHNKVLEKLGWREKTASVNYAVLAWENCLAQLNYDADVVFLGDSITRGSNFSKAFPDTKIINLGYSGDTLHGMLSRVSMVSSVSPEKVFLMGGINGLTDTNLDGCVNQYRKLLIGLQEAVPNAEIYIQSVLPIAREKEVTLSPVCHNTTVEAFNTQLQLLATEFDMQFIDLYHLYEKDGQLNPDFSLDGIHIKEESYTHWAEAIRPYITAK